VGVPVFAVFVVMPVVDRESAEKCAITCAEKALVETKATEQEPFQRELEELGGGVYLFDMSDAKVNAGDFPDALKRFSAKHPELVVWKIQEPDDEHIKYVYTTTAAGLPAVVQKEKDLFSVPPTAP